MQLTEIQKLMGRMITRSQWICQP